jgi:hypothetical protein
MSNGMTLDVTLETHQSIPITPHLFRRLASMMEAKWDGDISLRPNMRLTIKFKFGDGGETVVLSDPNDEPWPLDHP